MKKSYGKNNLSIEKYIRRGVLPVISIIALAFPTLTTAAQGIATPKPATKTAIKTATKTAAKPATKTGIDLKTPVHISKGVDISSDGLEANLRKDIVVFVGNVIVKQKDLTLNSDRVTVYYQKKKDRQSAINRIDASGNVKLATKIETITATWGIYDFIDKIITLGGKVILKRGNGEITGKRLIYNLATGLITIDGMPRNQAGNGSHERVKGQFKLPEKSKKQ